MYHDNCKNLIDVQGQRSRSQDQIFRYFIVQHRTMLLLAAARQAQIGR